MRRQTAVQFLGERVASMGIDTSDERIEEHAEEPCAICGGPSTRGVPLETFVTESLTDQNTFKSVGSEHVCWACVFVRRRLSVVPGRDPKPCDMCAGTGLQPSLEAFKQRKTGKRGPQRQEGEICEKCDGTKTKESGGRYSNFSHFIDGTRYESASKGEKPKILGWLRGPKAAPWGCVIADSGQKHLLPYMPLNPSAKRGRIMFELAEVSLPTGDDGWRIVDDACDLLTSGATKEEMLSGQYTARAYQLCREKVESFERAYGSLRGGSWFALVLWLSQRDEEAVALRVEAEKAAQAERKQKQKEAAKRVGRKEKAGARDDAGGGAPVIQAAVPEDTRRKHTGELEDRPGSNGGVVTVVGDRRQVVHDGAKAPPDSTAWQGTLFGLAELEPVRPRQRRVARGAQHD